MIDFKKKLEETEKGEKSSSEEEAELFLINKKRKRITTYTIAIIVIALVFSGRIIMSSQNATSWFPGAGILDKLKHLVPSIDKKLKGEENNRVNILLLGMGGEGHDGAYLTDTMILASFQTDTKQVALISVPRDLTAPVSGWRKINSVNAYAEQKTPGSGGEVTSQAISELFQVPIDYYVRADFDGFVNIIDELGGIEVNVENTLDDYSYPIGGQEDNPSYYARFEHLHFDKGMQTMNGAMALKYTRSRHASGSEGSDFSRAHRQQLVLEAIKNKLFSSKTLLNPVMVTKLVNEFSKNISTNLNAWEILRLWDLFNNVDRTQITNKVLSDAPDGLLISGIGEEGAYILTPRSGNFGEIRSMVQNIFSATPLVQTKQPATITDSASVLVLNGTWITGLAGKTSVMLTQSKFNVLKTANAPERNYSQTTVYDLSDGGKAKSLLVLKTITSAAQSSGTPAWLPNYQLTDSSTPDFLLILGTDANKAE